MSVTETVLAVRDLSVNFGGLKALSKVNLELRRGEVLGLIGPNGAGKTTLFNALSGIVKPTTGSLELFGDCRDWPKPHQLVELGLSRTLQGVGLFPDLTVLENVMIGASKFSKRGMIAAGLGRQRNDDRELRERAMVYLEKLYCGHIAARKANTLSYPDTKRVAIARALVSQPKILLLDEPAGGLGAEDMDWMIKLIDNLRSETAVMIVEHHMDMVMQICDRIYVLNFGEVISSGTPAAIREDQNVIEAYLGASAGAGR